MKSILLLMSFFSAPAFAAITYSCAEAPSATPVEVKIDDAGQVAFGDGITNPARDEGCRPGGKDGRVYRVVSGMAFIYIRVPDAAFAGISRVRIFAGIHGVNGMGPACSPHRLICDRTN